MRHVRVIALLLVMSPASAMAGKETNFTDEQFACVTSATKDYLATNAQFVLLQLRTGWLCPLTIRALRRLQKEYCKQYAACLSSNTDDATRRETAIRALFADCLDDEVVKEK